MATTSDDRSSLAQKILAYGGLLFALIIVLVPYSYVALSAFKPPGEIFEVKWFPDEWSLESWRYAIESVEFHKYILNSFFAGLGAAAIALLIAVPGGYIFGRKQFKGKETLFYFIILALLFPFVLLIVPLTISWIKVGLYDTMFGLWLSYQVFIIPFGLWMLAQEKSTWFRPPWRNVRWFTAVRSFKPFIASCCPWPSRSLFLCCFCRF